MASATVTHWTGQLEVSQDSTGETFHTLTLPKANSDAFADRETAIPNTIVQPAAEEVAVLFLRFFFASPFRARKLNSFRREWKRGRLPKERERRRAIEE